MHRLVCDNQFINIVSFHCETVISVTTHLQKKREKNWKTKTPHTERMHTHTHISANQTKMKISKLKWMMFDEPF